MNLLHRRLSVSYAAANSWLSMDEIGHKRPCKAAFQFEYLMRALAHLNGRFSASNLL
jgi:hypothetical protein